MPGTTPDTVLDAYGACLLRPAIGGSINDRNVTSASLIRIIDARF